MTGILLMFLLVFLFVFLLYFCVGAVFGVVFFFWLSSCFLIEFFLFLFIIFLAISGPLNNLMVILIYGTLSTIGSLSTFSTNKLIFWREASQNISIFGVWFSRNVIDLLFVR